MGLGLHGGGVGAAEFFAKIGAKVTVTDLRTRQKLKESIRKLKDLPASNVLSARNAVAAGERNNAGWPIKYVLGKHRKEDFKIADLVIRNPAVPDDSPYLKIAREHSVPIDTDIGIFFEYIRQIQQVHCGQVQHRLCPFSIIGVTGTRGKSTTATLIYEFLNKKYKNVILAGNIRKSVLLELPQIFSLGAKLPHGSLAPKALRRAFVILELSSWQLEGLAKHKKSPRIAVVTNIMPDHLNRYNSMKGYIAAKKLIFKYQSKNDFLFLNKDDKIVRSFAKTAKSKVIFYSAKNGKKYESFGFLPSAEKPRLLGKHNLTNIAAAVKVAKYLGVGDNVIKKVLKNFRGLEGRIQQIAEIKGVKYVNDTTATTPDAAAAAIETITNNYKLKTNKLIMIAGGADKNLSFDKLAKIIVKNVETLILLPGTATPKFKKSIERLKVGSWKLDIHRANNMHKAVKMAYNIARIGDIVLLSPACASFGMFRHEFERGEKFKEAVKSIK